MNVVSSLKKEDRLLTMLGTALGPQIALLLYDPIVVEVMLNPDGKVWVDRLGEGRSDTKITVNAAAAQRVIEIIASSTGAICNNHNPILSAELPGSGSRFQGFLPPITTAPCFAIRKKAVMIFTLNDYVEKEIMTEFQKNTIIQAIHDKKNILIVGGTGSGKTTLANAILDVIATIGDRNIIIQDTLELQCDAPDTVFLRSRENVSMNDLLRATMRLRPDRIIVGEVRGPEALTLLKSWNTGHPGGCATVHANSAYGGLTRLEQLIQENPGMVNPQQKLIAEAINMIIYIERHQHGRTLKEIALVEAFKNDEYIIKYI